MDLEAIARRQAADARQLDEVVELLTVVPAAVAWKHRKALKRDVGTYERPLRAEFDPTYHPRDRTGKWVRSLRKLKPGDTHELPGGVKITRLKGKGLLGKRYHVTGGVDREDREITGTVLAARDAEERHRVVRHTEQDLMRNTFKSLRDSSPGDTVTLGRADITHRKDEKWDVKIGNRVTTHDTPHQAVAAARARQGGTGSLAKRKADPGPTQKFGRREQIKGQIFGALGPQIGYDYAHYADHIYPYNAAGDISSELTMHLFENVPGLSWLAHLDTAILEIPQYVEHLLKLITSEHQEAVSDALRLEAAGEWGAEFAWMDAERLEEIALTISVLARARAERSKRPGREGQMALVLAEGALMFDPQLHPRDRLGKWTRSLFDHAGKLDPGSHPRGEPTFPRWKDAAPGTRVRHNRTGREGSVVRPVVGADGKGHLSVAWDPHPPMDKPSVGKVVAPAYDLSPAGGKADPGSGAFHVAPRSVRASIAANGLDYRRNPAPKPYQQNDPAYRPGNYVFTDHAEAQSMAKFAKDLTGEQHDVWQVDLKGDTQPDLHVGEFQSSVRVTDPIPPENVRLDVPKGKADPGAPGEATVGVTSFRGDETAPEAYAKGREFPHILDEQAKRWGVEISPHENLGVWDKTPEPSWAVDVRFDDPEKLKGFVASLGRIGDQDSVGYFRPDPEGKGLKLTTRMPDGTDDAYAQEELVGLVGGGSVSPGGWVTYWATGDEQAVREQAEAFARFRDQMGGSREAPKRGEVVFVERGDYDRYEQEAAGHAGSALGEAGVPADRGRGSEHGAGGGRDASDEAVLEAELAGIVGQLEEAARSVPFDPSAHPRFPRGDRRGGQFRPKILSDVPGLDGAKKKLHRLADGMPDMSVPGTKPPSDKKLAALGAAVKKVADLGSTVPMYRAREKEIDAELSSLDAAEVKLQADYSPGSRILFPEPEFSRQTEAIWRRKKSLYNEKAKLSRDIERAQRDALVGALAEVRPMGGKLDVLSNATGKPFARGKNLPMVADVGRVFPSDWVKGSNEGTVKVKPISRYSRGCHRAEGSSLSLEDGLARPLTDPRVPSDVRHLAADMRRKLSETHEWHGWAREDWERKRKRSEERVAESESGLEAARQAGAKAGLSPAEIDSLSLRAGGESPEAILAKYRKEFVDGGTPDKYNAASEVNHRAKLLQGRKFAALSAPPMPPEWGVGRRADGTWTLQDPDGSEWALKLGIRPFDSEIEVPTGDSSTFAHEMMHRFQRIVPLWTDVENRYQQSRIGSEKKVSLKTLHPRSGYKRDELSAPDGFFDDYMGKSYQSGETEVATMALQALMYPDASGDIFEKDPETAHWMLGAMATL